MAHEWKIGDWAQYKGVRYLVYNVTSDGYGVYLVAESAYGKHGHCSLASNDSDLKHLPDCTGWDWEPPKPIVPPEGYRLITEGKLVKGDIYQAWDGYWYECKSTDYMATGLAENSTAYARKIEQPKPIKPPEGYRLLEREEVVLDGDICIERAPLGNVHDWRSAGGKSIGCHAGWRMDNYGVECFARKIQRYRPFANAAEFAPHRDKWLADEDGDLVRVITLADKKLATSYGSISFKDAFERYKFEDGTPFGVPE